MPGSELEAAVKEPIRKELITILYVMETESLQIHVHILYVLYVCIRVWYRALCFLHHLSSFHHSFDVELG